MGHSNLQLRCLVQVLDSMTVGNLLLTSPFGMAPKPLTKHAEYLWYVGKEPQLHVVHRPRQTVAERMVAVLNVVGAGHVYVLSAGISTKHYRCERGRTLVRFLHSVICVMLKPLGSPRHVRTSCEHD